MTSHSEISPEIAHLGKASVNVASRGEISPNVGDDTVCFRCMARLERSQCENTIKMFNILDVVLCRPFRTTSSTPGDECQLAGSIGCYSMRH